MLLSNSCSKSKDYELTLFSPCNNKNNPHQTKIYKKERSLRSYPLPSLVNPLGLNMTRNFFYQKFFWNQRFLGLKYMFWQKKFWPENSFWQKNLFTPVFFTQHFFRQILFDQKNFNTPVFFGSKIFRTTNIFLQKNFNIRAFMS